MLEPSSDVFEVTHANVSGVTPADGSKVTHADAREVRSAHSRRFSVLILSSHPLPVEEKWVKPPESEDDNNHTFTAAGKLGPSSAEKGKKGVKRSKGLQMSSVRS